MIFSKQTKPPYGRAQRLGVPELQTKLDRFCLYKNMIFHMKMTFSKQIKPPKLLHTTIPFKSVFSTP